MKILNEMVDLANKANAAGQGTPEMVEFRVVANPDNTLAIAEAFRELEQEVKKNLEGAFAWQNRAEAAEAKLAELESNPLIDHLEKCSAIVSTWPEWKKQGADASKFNRPAPPSELVPDDYFGDLVAKARSSAGKAMVKFPQPNYVLLKVAEEAGEVVQAGVHYAENRMSWGEVEGEIVQLMAMLIRLVTEGDQVNGITPPESCRDFSPAPAADLAELVPGNDLLRVLDFAKFVIKCVRKNGEYAPLSSQEPNEIDAILRKI